ncbi:MAG: hypothetical protein ACYC6G_10850 [Desulfobaccales bacterium]
MHNHDKGALHAGTFLALGMLLLCLAGCYPPSAVEQDWGNSVRNNIAQQVVNPQAGLNTTPPVGLSPQAGVNEMDAYNKSFAPEAQKSSQLSYGASSGGGSSGGGSSGY